MMERLVQHALLCYDEAERSTDQPEGADLDVKIPFERGTLLQWLSEQGYGDYWTEAQQNLREAITIYEGAEAEKQARLRVQAAFAHGYLGHQILATSGDIEAALTEFRAAVNIFLLEANREYAQPSIDAYRTQIAVLEATLTATAP
jgi:hypothetical protein